MENSLKQRIIGAIVLIALGVIFLPAILKEKSSNGVFQSKIPKKPKELDEYKMDTYKIDELLIEEESTAKDIKSKAIKIQKEIEKTDDVLLTDNIEEPQSNQLESTSQLSSSVIPTQTPAPSAKKKTSVKANSNVSDGAWVLQVASFSKLENSTNMVTKLKSEGFKAYSNHATFNNKVVFRVFVGPFVKKDNAAKILKNVEKHAKTKVLLKTYNPVKH